MLNTDQTLVQWVTAAPLWADLARAGDATGLKRFRQPALLRFASDSFMDEFHTLAQTAPLQIAGLRALPETWNGPAPTPALPSKVMQRAIELKKARGFFTPRQALAALNELRAVPALPQATAPVPLDLKLYQPAHLRYYLVTGCLICRTPGLPDRVLNNAANERVTFVVRRLAATYPGKPLNLADPKTLAEHAFVDQGGTRAWQKLEQPDSLFPGEEQLPLFALNYAEMDGRKRRLLSGLVPVSRREAYVHAGRHSCDGELERPTVSFQPAQPRAVQLLMQAIEPWKALVDRAEKTWNLLTANEKDNNPDANQKRDILKVARRDIQAISWLILLDLSKWLKAHAGPVWDVVAGTQPADSLSGNPKAQAAYGTIAAVLASSELLTAIVTNENNGNPPNSPVPKMALDVALRRIQDAVHLEDATAPYTGALGNPFPDFRFPLADPQTNNLGSTTLADPVKGAAAPNFQAQRDGLDKFAATLTDALSPVTTVLPPMPLVAQAPLSPNEPAWFVIRMLFESPACGPLKPEIVSEPTEPFQMAAYYDPDAPARPLRIAMPLDTSPAGLRKFDKNTAFVISDLLCGQVQKARGLGLGDLVRSVLPFPFHKDLDAGTPDCSPGHPDVAMMCALSIPIITVCAFILLMVMVSLLDFIFRWMPFFILCFPVPKFKIK